MNKTSRIFSIIIYSTTLFFGISTIIFSIIPGSRVFNYDPSLIGNELKHIILFSGVIILIFGVLLFLKNENMIIFFERILKKIYFSFKNEKRYHLYALLWLFLFSIIVRSVFITRALNYHEALNFLNYSAGPFFSGALKYDTSSNFILNSILVSLIKYVFGGNLWVLRSISFFSGILLCPAIYMTSRIYFNKFTALIAAGIVAASPILILYSTNLDGISLFLLIIVLFLALARYLRDRDEVIPWIIFVLLSAFGFTTSPIFFYPFFVMFLWLFISALVVDNVKRKKQQIKKVLIYSTSSLILSYIFYIPEIMKNGVKKILTLNFPLTSSKLTSLKSLISNFYISWSQWNAGFPILLGVVSLITIIIALVFFKKGSSAKIPILAIILAELFLAVIMRVYFQGESLIFILPVLIMISAQGLYLIINIIFRRRVNNFKTKIFVLFSLLIAIFIFSTSFINNFISSYNKDISPPGIEDIIVSLKNNVTPTTKISVKPPLDYFFMFYGSKYGISINNWNGDLFSSDNLFIFQNKDSDTGINALNDEYFKGKSAHLFGFTEPELFKDFALVKVYKTYPLKTSEIPVFDYDLIKSRGIFNHVRIDETTQKISFDETNGSMLKSLQVPINLDRDTDYLITFDINKEGELENSVFVDFFGQNYDKSTQEFTILPDEIKDRYTPFRFVLSTGEIPDGIQVFFRIFTTVSAQLHLKNIKISRVLDN